MSRHESPARGGAPEDSRLAGGSSTSTIPPATDAQAPMTRAERTDLARLTRARARVAKAAVVQREAELLADVESQLSAAYSFDDDAWADVTRAAQSAVAEADEQVAERCRQLGIPERFRPSLYVGWSGRGENATAARRGELRKLAQTHIAAAGKAAKAQIEARAVEVEGEIVAAGLTTEAARAFLRSIPEPAELMPTLALGELESELTTRTSRRNDATRSALYGWGAM